MDVKAYFHRLGLEMPENPVPDSALLRRLHLAHCTMVPYENMDMLRGIPTSLDEDALFRKIVEQGRGGLCFELNGSFGNLLRHLGYGVTDYAGRYLRGEPTPPMRRHRVLKVEATDGTWLCDVVIGDMFSLTAQNPLIGPNLDEFGPRFPDMSCVFDRELRALAHACAREQGFALREGVYAQMTGPTYETPAEIRMLRTLGADAVGMSTVPEVVVARHGGMRVLGVSCITNMAAGILDQPLNHAEVTETANRVKGQFRALLDAVVEKM